MKGKRKKDWEEIVEQNQKISITFSKTCVRQLSQCAKEYFVILKCHIKKKNNRKLMSQELNSRVRGIKTE